jgi:hypothetical protein
MYVTDSKAKRTFQFHIISFCMVLILAATWADATAKSPKTASKNNKTTGVSQNKSMNGNGAFFAVSDGKGQIRLFWLPPLEKWPSGGWRLEELGSGRVLQERIMPGEAGALALLSKKDAQEAIGISNLLVNTSDPKKRQLAFAIVAAKAAGEWNFARAMGLGWTSKGESGGKRAYRVTGLDAAGKVTPFTLTSAYVDPEKSTPLPSAPLNLRAESTEDGVRLSWAAPELSDRMNLLKTYFVERDGVEKKGIAVTEKPRLLSGALRKEAHFVDPNAEPENESVYRVYYVDLFGRRGAPAEIKIFFSSVGALVPPGKVAAKPGENKVEIIWEPKNDPYTAGYVVERSFLYNGPYEALTPKGLPQDTKKYVDDSVRGGTAYYYRLRSIGPRGDLGSPSLAVMAQPRNENRPPRPEDLKVDVGPTRVRLTWEPVKVPVAGYFIQRRQKGMTKWMTLNDRVTPEPLYDDFFGEHNAEQFSYRIIAVAFDNKESDPCKPVEVILLDTLPPPPPVIREISGKGGKVAIDFVPGEPKEDTYQFLVLRGGSPRDPGVVIGDPLGSDARRFEDLFVEAGKTYFYRLAALDKSGNRSELSRPIAVAVGTPEIPTPRKPRARFEREPFVHVKVNFDPAPFGLAAIVQSDRGSENKWIKISGPVSSGGEAIDASPPEKGKVLYRILYVTPNGVAGEPSDVAEVSVR